MILCEFVRLSSPVFVAKVALGNLCFHMRELVVESYTAVRKDVAVDASSGDCASCAAEEEDDDRAHVPQDVRRRLNVVFAFIRQQLRESKAGFLPGSGMEQQKFNASTFYMDPVRPRLWDTMTQDEVARYMNVPVHSRATTALGELKVLCQLYSDKLKPGSFTIASLQAFKGIHDATQAMIRIRDSPVPFPYIFILNVTTFAFVYLTPFLYTASTVCMFLGTQLLVFSYYSILQIGLQLENPFGYDSFDIPLEDFGRDVHDETLALATSLGADTKTFIPQHLEGTSSCSGSSKDVSNVLTGA